MRLDVILIGLAIGLVAIGVLSSIVAGIRSLLLEKTDLNKMMIMIVPFAIYLVSYLVTRAWDEAGIATMLVLMGVMAVAMAVTGLKGTFRM